MLEKQECNWRIAGLNVHTEWENVAAQMNSPLSKVLSVFLLLWNCHNNKRCLVKLPTVQVI